ncbi:NIPSNAP family protein [Actinophytocola oryzae]|uniref:NIPSNAP protein n=1 Tax=Actinophytocola oryzae TaxID=502181 RepID=A0A4R7VDL9_9PSEU|nr:NIPSNAP family protein [Actinophytocola oryzae]TDV47098.1 NIPSNAP protein [Actinophytocola oryzae]
MTEVLELRQYTLHPGRRDDLVELFDREFVEPQEAVGAQVLGQFRDLDDQDRFVWLRGYSDMDTRGRALPAFYGGPVWRAHSAAANDTMIDSDDVLLLRPEKDLDLTGRTRGGPTTLVTVTIYHLPPGGEDAFVDVFRTDAVPLLTDTGAEPLAILRTLRAENNFPALPVRENENVVVWIASFAGRDELVEHVHLLGREGRWTHGVLPDLTKRLAQPPEQLQLAPTARSLLR